MQMCKGICMVVLCLYSFLLPEHCIAQLIDNYIPPTQAKQPIINCGSDILLFNARKNPAFIEREKKMNDEILRALTKQVARNGGNGTGTAADPYILPVVFHLVNAAPGSGYTDQQITAALQDLNDAFSKSGAYAASTGADTKIRFVLAKKDPDGGLSTGITRTVSSFHANQQMDIEDGRLKNLNIWDPFKYINIWVVDNIIGEIMANFGCGVWSRSGVAGYANFPTNVGTSYDGIVVTKFKDVLAHEMGHYLGLYHTFEGGCQNNNCLTDGDHVCDTPPEGMTVPAANCSSASNSCNTDSLSNFSNGFFPRDVADQIQNFMDYNNAACANMFTEGQAQRMRATIATQRSGLLTDVITAPCTGNVTAAFTRDNNNPKTGDGAINFTNASINTTASSTYQWLIGNTVVATSVSFSYTFTRVDKYKVTLKVTDGGCMSSYSDFVIVNCGVIARFYNNKQSIASKTGILNDTIYFTNNSIGATSYEWAYQTFNPQQSWQTVTSNAPTLSPNDLNYIFGTPVLAGNIKLIARNGTCVDSTVGLAIFNHDPTADAVITILNASCFQDTKVKVDYFVCNYGFVTIPVNMPVTFYDADPSLGPANKIVTRLLPDSVKGSCCGRVFSDTIDIGKRNLDKLFAVVNDAGNSSPWTLPNTSLVESSFTNNIASFSNIRFYAGINAPIVNAEQGDTLQLVSIVSPSPAINYAWSTTSKLTCPNCPSTSLITDTSTVVKLAVTSQFQCHDTTSVAITVVPGDDFQTLVKTVSCVPGEDSMVFNFTIQNLSKRGIIPKGLQVAFYKNDPTTDPSAVLLGPVFTVPADVLTKAESYNTKVKKTRGGFHYAVVNMDGSAAIPFALKAMKFPEKDVANNLSFFNYVYYPSSLLQPYICEGESYEGYTKTGIYRDTFVTAGGCDSVRLLMLYVRPEMIKRTSVTVALCAGESYDGGLPKYAFSNAIYTKSGTYIDTFWSRGACDSIRTLHLTVYPAYQKTNTVKICRGASYFAAGKNQTVAGVYRDTLKSITGCDSIVITNLSIAALPTGFLPKDSILCIDRTLDITLSGYNSVNWSTGSNANKITVTQAGAYTATVVDKNGCIGKDTINISYQTCIPILIPTAFTPNGDGKNDLFKPTIGIPVTNYTLQVWSRLGEMIYETHNVQDGWNGKIKGEPQSMAVFIYLIRFTDNLGQDYLNKGTVLLMR